MSEPATIGTCKDCQFYLGPCEDELPYHGIDGTVIASNCDSGRFLYQHPKGTTHSISDGVLYQDLEFVGAYIRVQPDFGCRHWALKKKKDDED